MSGKRVTRDQVRTRIKAVLEAWSTEDPQAVTSDELDELAVSLDDALEDAADGVQRIRES